MLASLGLQCSVFVGGGYRRLLGIPPTFPQPLTSQLPRDRFPNHTLSFLLGECAGVPRVVMVLLKCCSGWRTGSLSPLMWGLPYLPSRVGRWDSDWLTCAWGRIIIAHSETGVHPVRNTQEGPSSSSSSENKSLPVLSSFRFTRYLFFFLAKKRKKEEWHLLVGKSWVLIDPTLSAILQAEVFQRTLRWPHGMMRACVDMPFTLLTCII